MLAIKLARTGKKKYPTYSLIVVEKSKDPWGDYTEKVGSYNPHSKSIDLKRDRVEHWLKIGAQPTPTVHNLLVAEGLVKGEKVRAGKSQPGKKRLAEIEASKKAEEDAKAKAEAEKLATEEAKKIAEETPVEPIAEEAVEAVAEEAVAETKTEETPVVEEVEAPVAEVEESVDTQVVEEEAKTE